MNVKGSSILAHLDHLHKAGGSCDLQFKSSQELEALTIYLVCPFPYSLRTQIQC